MKICISVIVPIYMGKQYIDRIIQMVEENSKKAREIQECLIELIFVNDFPIEQLEIQESKEISIKLIINSKNQGIHASRVNGLKASNGEFVLFLDQDDIIDSRYIKKQLAGIGNADAIVCNARQNDTMMYFNEESYCNVTNLRKYFVRNQIVSPGQVLIRKAAIPNVWKDSILAHNGSDDYFLWILMLAANRKFAVNKEVLFEHVITGNNTSCNTEGMNKSILDVCYYLEKNNVISADDSMIIRQNNLRYQQGKYYKYTDLMDKWMEKLENGDSLNTFFSERKYSNIAIYGMGILGRHLKQQLGGTDIRIQYIIDKRKDLIRSEIQVINLGENMSDIDAIIVTPFDEFENIKEELVNYYSCDIVSLEDIICCK